MLMYLMVVTVSWLYTYLQSYCAEYIKYINTHILLGKQSSIILQMTKKCWQEVNNDKMFHHAALQHTPMQKHLSYLNTGVSNFHLLQPAQRPPTHGACCTVKPHLNKPQLETKFGARPTGSKRHCFYLNRSCFLSMGSQRVGGH